ncbi:unnamed protein product [Psylliodes chrysocephalus]|uniref:Uncharacterized protein n=1 Tax=Psylliodes chrysocephalus TaxID=3402493 RepID=A0A9P0CVP5_9CUCU|nr:unnamed protein product [Psylliodes chrysocephala]
MDVGFKLKHENPKKRANVLKKLFFGWMITVIRKAAKTGLDVNDLYKAMQKDKSEQLGDRLEHNWNKELLKSKEKDFKPSLLRSIFKTFYKEFMLYGVLWFVTTCILWSSLPLILAHLISLFSGPFDETKQTEMYITGAGLVLVSGCVIFTFHHANFGLSAIGMRIRIASSSLMYRKITRLNQKSLGETAAGQIINLLSNDVNRFDLAITPLHSLWVMPFQVAYLSYIIWNQVGISSLAGIISMALVALPLQGYLAKVLGQFRLKVSKKTDTRVKLMTEIISGIQVIKMYAWEKPFEQMVKLARFAEIKDIKVASYIRGVFNGCVVFLERLALCLTVICYVLLGNDISPSIVFSLAQCFNILQFAMAIMYPMAISLGAEALISIKRIQEFLLLEEREVRSIIEIKTNGIILTGINASWTDNGSTLTDINLEIPPGTLCAVVGPVGAGKSSLIQLLLGELVEKSGKIQMGGEVSYSSQNPWLFQSTVRNNILFGQPYNKNWYETIVKVCALERDFEQFPRGDQTVVGERGVSLSGGQRARINLARAVYRQADIYLMDDPLSAVDTHVGKHLFEECINKHLRGKTRILVTHQLQYLKKANLIVVINEGKIEAQGTFDELLNSKLDFTKLLIDTGESGEKPDDIHVPEIESMKDRKISVLSWHSDISECLESTLQPAEGDQEEGNDPNSKPFKDYLLAAKSICLLVFLITLMIVAQGVCACADLWVAFWTTQEEIRHTPNSTILEATESPQIEIFNIGQTNTTNLTNNFRYDTNPNSRTPILSVDIDDLFDYIKIDDTMHKLIKTQYAMYLYAVIIALAVILTIGRSFLFYKTCMLSSINLHYTIFNKLLKAPMKFFDTNPSGRVLNRFSKDMGAIDEVLPRVLMDAVGIVLVMCGILVNVSISNPYIIIAIIVLGAVFLQFRNWYIASAKVIKHLEGIAKSPMFSHVNSTLNGITTIRASNAEDVLIDEFDSNQDVHTAAWYLLIACMGSFGLWLDIISLIFTASVTFSFIYLHSISAVNGALVGLAISQSMILTGMLQHGMRQTAEVVNQLTSVERVLQYTTMEQEGPFDTPKDNIPKDEWPKEGLVEFKDLSLKYVEDEPPVLKQLNFTLYPGQKIGIVGRTGAGKTSLISALFRLAPLEGAIFIDGLDTKTFGLNDLRKKISIIPQEPILFSATLRYNLDPFGEYEDDKIWKALEQVELKDAVDSLDFMVAEGGGNFSLGQRQLVCLARAVLRNNKILVLDEATANVDQRTDSFIQTAIRQRFKDCTVLTIAHRLNTIMDSDKVLVMSFGSLVEFDHPHNLLQIPDGYFHKMVLETGPVMAMQLKDVALEAYLKKENQVTELK